MYLACIEIAASSHSHVLQEEFVDLEPAKVWADEESAHHDGATGNAAVFETAGPLMAVVWERPETDVDPRTQPAIDARLSQLRA